MKEKPIIFSGPMVRAILDGRKSMTRRVVKPPLDDMLDDAERAGCAPMVRRAESVERVGDSEIGRPEHTVGSLCAVNNGPTVADITEMSPYGQPGDRLWVRETFAYVHGHGCVYYRADDPTDYDTDGSWSPSIHMPRWASRITLEITGIRVERVQDISVEDMIAEGMSTKLRDHDAGVDLREQFSTLWNHINAKRGYGWGVNPWVWCISFKRVSPGEYIAEVEQ